MVDENFDQTKMSLGSVKSYFESDSVEPMVDENFDQTRMNLGSVKREFNLNVGGFWGESEGHLGVHFE